MKIIVAGSRRCTDVPLIYTTLSAIVQHSDIAVSYTHLTLPTKRIV